MSSAISPELIKMVGSLINSAVNEEGQVRLSLQFGGKIHKIAGLVAQNFH